MSGNDDLSPTGLAADEDEHVSCNPNCAHRASALTWRTPVTLFVHRTKMLWSQLTLSEISGSLGDSGTFIPLTVAMARQRSIYLAPALFFAGLANIFTGYLWDVPMCVQPMKAIAAVAISESISREQVTAAGMWMGILCVVLGITQLIQLVNMIVPLPVVCGIQIGVGLRLATSGLVSIAKLGWVDQADCILLALLVSLLCMYWLRESSSVQVSPPSVSTWWDRLFCLVKHREHPVGLYLFFLGVIFATVELCTTDNADGQYELPLGFFGAPVGVLALESVAWNDWKVGFLEGALPQLPLTTLNSVISVCCLAHSLYPEKRHNDATTDGVVSRREVCVGVGLMNLLFCPFGSMPNCHGAGGLAAQHRLGARHGASMVFLGVNKVLLAIFFGASVLTILDAIPTAILGVMLAIAGQELSTFGLIMVMSSTESKLRKHAVIAIVTAMVIVSLEATHYGAISGWVMHMVYGDGTTDFIQWIHNRRAPREESVENQVGGTVHVSASSESMYGSIEAEEDHLRV